VELNGCSFTGQKSNVKTTIQNVPESQGIGGTMTKKEFQKAFSLIFAAYPLIEFPPITQKLHFKMFKNLDCTVYQKAIMKYIDHGKFPPSVADIVACVNEVLSVEQNIPTIEDVKQEISTIVETSLGQSWSRADYNPITIEIMNEMGGKYDCGLMPQQEFEKKLKTCYRQVTGHFKNCLLEGREFTDVNLIDNSNRSGSSSLVNALSDGLSELDED